MTVWKKETTNSKDLKKPFSLLVQRFLILVSIHKHFMLDEAKEARKMNLENRTSTSRTRCIVHCMRGRSRSAGIVIGIKKITSTFPILTLQSAYLMKRENLSLKDAYSEVKKKRIPIGPHYHIRKQLIDFEEQYLERSLSLPIDEWGSIQRKIELESKN